MKSAPGGDHVPNATLTFLIANQGLATNTAFTVGPVPCNGARVANSVPVVGVRGGGPLTAGGCQGTYRAVVAADDTVSVVVSNNNSNALVALGADVLLDVMCLPIVP